MKQKTIHISFPKEDMDLYHELMEESSLSYVPASALVRNYLKTGMKTKQKPRQSKEQHLAALYDACSLILDTYRETDIFKVYSDEGLEDHINFAATAREIMGLIAEGDIK